MTVSAIVVDGSRTVVGFAQKALERLGYQVLSADNGENALRLCEEHRNRFQLVIVDVFRSGSDHRIMVERMRRTQPDMKVIYTSGLSAEILRQYGVRISEDELLEKPFTMDDLHRKLDRLNES